MKKLFYKKSIIITSVTLLLLVAVGTTLAYIFTNTDSVENAFKPSKVACAVVENGRDPVSGSLVNTGSSKDNVQIKNTGDTDAYIRVAVVVNWASEDGTKIWAQKPVLGTDYTISYATGTGWADGGDGYYYYTEAVPAVNNPETDIDETLTGILISSATREVAGPKGTDGTQYHLSIEIVASAIQAKGMGATSAQDAWAKAQQQNG